MNQNDHKDLLTMIQLEYNAMRDEIRNCESHIFQIMQVSLTVIFALAGVAAANIGTPNILHIICLFIVPAASFSALILIFTEVLRVKRAGDYICILEAKMQLLFSNRNCPELEQWKPMQKTIEDCLQIGNTNVRLSSPLIFESWIRELENIRDKKRRLVNFSGIRYLMFFFLPCCAYIISFLSQLIFYDNSIFVMNSYILHLISLLIYGLISVYIIMQGRKLLRLIKEQKVPDNVRYKEGD